MLQEKPGYRVLLLLVIAIHGDIYRKRLVAESDHLLRLMVIEMM